MKRFLLSKGFCEYIITIAATILGVTLAIIFTDYDTNKKDCSDTIEFLEILDEELMSKEKIICGLLAYINMTDKESFTGGYDKTTFSPMLSLEVILNNEPYLSTLSGSTYSTLLLKRASLDMMQKELSNATSRFDTEENMIWIILNMDFIRSVVEIEKMYQNKEISEKEVEERIDKLQLDEAKRTNDILMEMAEGLEDSEWKSKLLKILKSIDDQWSD